MFRWVALVVLVVAIATSAVYRRRARQGSETIDRRREGPLFVALRLAVALPLFGSVVLAILAPGWMRWATLELPEWARWLGIALGVATIPAIHWTLGNLGRNVSETVLTKRDHALVTSGPYRWVRHPLYTTGLALFAALGLMTASWLVLALATLAGVLVRSVVVPREERALVAAFGQAYEAYRERTGRFLPRLSRRA